MINIERKFEWGYASPVDRGVYFWLDAEKQRDLWIDQLVYDALGDDYDLGYGADLHGITISIKIEKTTKSEWPQGKAN